ncbi:MAG: DUF98 domain-containing protein [Desulfobacterales bacterium]|nr:DUF98 domain-containing protein [Desulfobacterales bacterium]
MLYQFSHQNQIEPSKLTGFQRILLTTDGTLTEILEALLSEKIELIKLSEQYVLTTCPIVTLEIESGRGIIERKILLQGKMSRNNWLYAESVIVPERLEETFRDDLLSSRKTIGRLWQEHRLETFKEVIASFWEFSGDIADYFSIQRADRLLCRTYRVFSNRKPIMMITEKFPESFFEHISKRVQNKKVTCSLNNPIWISGG